MSDHILPPHLVAQPRDAKVVLRLYVVGSTPRSSRAIANIKTICETHLKESYTLTVVDLFEHKLRAQGDEIVVAPTLVRLSPLPERRIFGNLSETDRVLEALDLAVAPHPL